MAETQQTDTVETPFNASSPPVGSDGSFELPDFGSMKKPALKLFIENHTDDQEEMHSLLGCKVAEMKVRLKAKYAKSDDLDSPEVTGFDPNDLVIQTMQKVQALEDPAVAISWVKDLQQSAGFSDFQIGGILAEMQAKGMSGEFNDFWEFVEDEFDIKQRKAQTLVQIYHACIGCGATFAQIQPMGWTKLAALLNVITPDNFEEWFKLAAESTCASLEHAVRESRKGVTSEGGDGTTAAPNESEPVVKKTFKIFKDQEEVINEAIEKVMHETGTESPGQALERICIAALNTTTQAPAPTETVEPGGEVELDLSGLVLDHDDLMVSFKNIMDTFEGDEGMSLILTAFIETYKDEYPDMDVECHPFGAPEDAEEGSAADTD